MISYDRDRDRDRDRDGTVTAALSEACDLRLLWGGDDAVTELRGFPLRPAARDLTFPRRSSLAVISAAGWLAASPTARRAVADGLYADAYPFDQAGCGSPSTIFWIGGPDEVGAAREELIALLRSVLQARPPVVPPEMAVQRRVAAYGLAIEGIATQVTFEGNAAVPIDLWSDAEPLRRWLGAGSFVHTRLNRLADLLPLVRRSDQTLTDLGFDPVELLDFARRCGRHGVDRTVPVGRSRDFGATWDGYDLLREFTRVLSVDQGVSGA
ncbi:acyl-CoA reductase [Micromonospora okii]|uniref:acyl-CoA reductase n=1 Tax=Micromonospora okii TaxID=1182970 RepID=UPI001E548F4A|nr:acyl-CoA reductase [Micromonospora okii]